MTHAAPPLARRRPDPLSRMPALPATFDRPDPRADRAPSPFLPPPRTPRFEAPAPVVPFAPTRFVERRRFPRQPNASIGRRLDDAPRAPAVASAAAVSPRDLSAVTGCAAPAMRCLTATPFRGESAVFDPTRWSESPAMAGMPAFDDATRDDGWRRSFGTSGEGDDALITAFASGAGDVDDADDTADTAAADLPAFLRTAGDALARVGDHLLAEPVSRLLGLLVCVSLAMTVLSTLLPMIDR